MAQDRDKGKAGAGDPVLMARNDPPRQLKVDREPVAAPRSILPTAPAKVSPALAYTGPDSGQFVWTGALNAGDSVTISGMTTEVSGSYLPGIAVQLEIVPPVVTVVTAPSASNRFKTVVLKNTSGRTQNLIIVKWKVTP